MDELLLDLRRDHWERFNQVITWRREIDPSGETAIRLDSDGKPVAAGPPYRRKGPQKNAKKLDCD